MLLKFKEVILVTHSFCQLIPKAHKNQLTEASAA